MQAPHARMADEVLAGLRRKAKELPSKYFYDARGAALFDRITALPEYYLTRTEHALLERHGVAWLRALDPAAVVELGPGSAEKTETLLDASRADVHYVPVDVSAPYLTAIAERIGGRFPDAAVHPVEADLSADLPDLPNVPRPALFAFLGSTIGNFEAEAAVALLASVRGAMREHDRLLLGADLRPGARKPREALEAAYNDAAGVTAAFNLNILEVMNRELGADFDTDAFAHRAFYAADEHRIEMHLVSTREQQVRVAGEVVHFARGETVRTELSCKYDRAALTGMMTAAGLRVAEWCTDPGEAFAILLAAPVT